MVAKGGGPHKPSEKLREMGRFLDEVTRHWLWTIRRRSQRGKSSWTWARMHKLVRRHLPNARKIHPYPEQRFRARLKARAV